MSSTVEYIGKGNRCCMYSGYTCKGAGSAWDMDLQQGGV